MLKSIFRAIVALLAGGIGGAVLSAIGAPLPWTLGALTTAAIVALLGRPWQLPGMARTLARPVVGVLAGGAFTAEIMAAMLGWWPAITLVLAYTILSSALGYLYFRYVAGFNHPTAFFAAMPAGLGELTLVGGSLGADTHRLVTVHFVRIVLIVVCVPLGIQYFTNQSFDPQQMATASQIGITGIDWLVLGLCAVVGYGINMVRPIPGGVMIYPLVLSALVHVLDFTHAIPPDWLVIFVQIVIGSVVGARFAGVRWVEMRRTALLALGWAVLLLGSVLPTAWLGAWLLDRDFASMALSLAPGGMVEMTIITLSMGGDISFVVTCQTVRIVTVVVSAPLLFGVINTSKRPAIDRDSIV